MRAPKNLGVLAFAASLAASGCIGPLAPRAPGASSSAAPSAAVPLPAARAAEVSPPASPAGIDDCDPSSEPAPAAEEVTDGDHATLDDGFEPEPDAPSAGAPSAPVPFAELSDAEIQAKLRDDIGALGPMSIGGAHGGVLVAGVRMPEGASWELVSPGLAWGTQETIDALTRAIDEVAARFPDGPKVFIGDLSRKGGGHLPPHVSHQSGRDVDVGYYLTEGHRWYATAKASNLDKARTWHLIRTLIAESDVDLILVDTQIQKILKAYALEIGEDPGWLDQVFQVGGKSRRPIVFHAKGHATHLHVRFYSPAAQELGRRAYRFLLARRLVTPPTRFITHTVKSGETLSHLALRYKVTPEVIKKANGMKKDTLRADKAYKIPQTGGIAMPARVVVPARRVPPAPAAVASAPPSGVQPCRRATPR